MMGLLEGVKVVEAAVLLTGDYLGMLLADEGADVVKVETPGVGDWIRDHMGEMAPRYSPYHLFVNRNKRSVTLNLKSDAGRAALHRLVATADVFVTGFTGDVPAKLGASCQDYARSTQTSSTAKRRGSERMGHTRACRRTARCNRPSLPVHRAKGAWPLVTRTTRRRTSSTCCSVRKS